MKEKRMLILLQYAQGMDSLSYLKQWKELLYLMISERVEVIQRER